jgi:ankyrin repeat protein
MGNKTAVALLLESGKNIAAVDTRPGDPYQTPRPILNTAVAAGNIEVLKTLGYRHHAFLHEASPGQSLQSLAAEKGKIAVVEFLLEVPSIDPSGPQQSSSPPIIHAAKHGHVDIVKFSWPAARKKS